MSKETAAMDIKHEKYVFAVDAIDPALLGLLWSVDDREGCDTAWMLRVVCERQTCETRVDLDEAGILLHSGHAPRGATPYPSAAEWLLARRGAERKHWPDCAMNHGGECDMGAECGT
jgi:hypothetical protein